LALAAGQGSRSRPTYGEYGFRRLSVCRSAEKKRPGGFEHRAKFAFNVEEDRR
jgi:hypothetical protein